MKSKEINESNVHVPGITFPLNLTQPSAHIWPSKYEPYIFLHCAQFRKQMPTISKSPAESKIKHQFWITFQDDKNLNHLIHFPFTKRICLKLCWFLLPITGLARPYSANVTAMKKMHTITPIFPNISIAYYATWLN